MLKIYPKITSSGKISNSASLKNKKADSTSFAGNRQIKTSVSLGELILGALNDGKNRLTVDTNSRIKTTNKQSRDLAEKAEKVFLNVKTFFEQYLKDYNLENTIQFFARPKGQTGITNKAKKTTLEQCTDISMAIKDLQNTKFSIKEILPAKKEKNQPILQIIKDETEKLLKKHSENGSLSAQKIQEIILPKKFKENYGNKGFGFAKEILEKTEDLLAQKAKKVFESISTTKKESPISEIRDAIGVRFVINKPKEDFNSLPLVERVNAFENYMKTTMNRLTEMLTEICQTSDTKMKRLISYGGNNQYLRGSNIERLKELEGMEFYKKNLKNGYISDQGVLEMKIDYKSKKIPLKIEFQIRGNEVNKFAEVEHIPYDLREGKQINLKKYNAEQRKLIEKIRKESKKIGQNEKLDADYSAYLEKCYNYQFAKEYGVTLPKPALPKEINEIMSMDSLFLLAHT